jgi:hypothetical protein
VPRAFTYFGQAALRRIGADKLASLLENTPVELNGASGKAPPPPSKHRRHYGMLRSTLVEHG